MPAPDPTPTVDPQSPTAPGPVAVSAVTESGFQITWAASTDNVYVNGYQYRVNGGAWSGQTTSQLVFTSPISSAVTYQVRAVDLYGNTSAPARTRASTSGPHGRDAASAA